MTARKWLLHNGYDDIVLLMDQAAERWKANGLSTRRNWSEVLAGTRKDQPRSIYGVTFPVLIATQKHEGMPVTSNAIQRSDNEDPSGKEFHGRSLTTYRTRS